MSQNKSSQLYLIFICIVATMGGLMFGFDVAIISGAVPFIQSYFGWNELQLGWGVSSLLVGAILGSILSGMFTDRFGRKKIMIVVAFFFALSCVGTALAQDENLFIAMRLFGGLAVGAVSVLAPMYVAEIAPAKVRGTLVAVYQLAVTFGILISYFINYSLHDVPDNWRWMFATGTVPALFYLVGLMFIPESPRWLYVKGYKDRARAVLARISSHEEADHELQQIEEGMKNDDAKSLWKELLRPSVRKSVLIGFLLAVFVQMCGINTIIDYAPKILLAAGVEIKNALLQTSLIGIINFVFTFIAILSIDKLGRRRLYLIGTCAMVISHILIGCSFYFSLNPYFTLVCLLLFIASFAAFIGPVFWTLVSEIFPNKVRGTAVAFASFTQWVFNFLIILFFPPVLAALGGGTTFMVLAVMCVLQLVLVYFWVPETKGKSLEEIEQLWTSYEKK